MMKRTIGRAGIALVAAATVATLVPSSAMADATTDSELHRRTASLTLRPVTPSGPPAQRLEAVSFEQNYLSGRISGRIVLRETPNAGTAASGVLALGYQAADGCRLTDVNTEISFNTYSGGAGVTRAGRTLSYAKTSNDYKKRWWSCGAVLINPGAPTDALATKSFKEWKVQLRAVAPTVRKAKRKRWTTVSVTVTNRGNELARGVRVTARGKGVRLKSNTLDFGTISAGRSERRSLVVKVTSKKDRSLSYSVTGTGLETGSDSVRVLTEYPRKKARPGKYRGKLGNRAFTFRVTRSGRVKGWKGWLTLNLNGTGATCGNGYFRVPGSAKIGKTGRVDYTAKRARFSTELHAVFDGARVRDGFVSYRTRSGGAVCSGDASWTAKRVSS